MKLTRRGLFGLGIGSILAALVGREDRYKPYSLPIMQAQKEINELQSWGLYSSTLIVPANGSAPR